jgi:predicted Zn-dependent peptidase
VYDVSAHLAHLTDVGTVDVRATVRLDQFDTFFRELFDALRSLADEGPDDEETARAVLRAVVDLDRTPEDPESAASRVAWDGLRGRPTSWRADRARLEAVTPGDVRRVAGSLFRSDRAALVVLGPGESGLVARLRDALADGLPARA